MNSSPGLCVDAVHLWRGDQHVLRGASLTLKPGELLHLWGPNGTGKTTLLRIICGLLRPEQGMVSWLGRPINQQRSEYQAAMAYVSHETALKGDLTAIENLRYSVGLKRRVSEAELRANLDLTGVNHCADLPVRILSAGQRRRVTMARLLALGATLWLLDEPYTNLDAAGSALMSQLLEQHVGAGGLAVVVAHQELVLGVEVRRMELTA